MVLHEDKQYYPDTEQVYGKNVEAILEEEDNQPLTVPIVAPQKTKLNVVLRKNPPQTKYEIEYLTSLMENPSLIRNVAILGHLHHGKTLLSDMLINQTLTTIPNHNEKYTDNRIDEINRKISLKCAPFQILLPDSRDKSYVFNFVDTPGHPDFSDEVSVSLSLADNVLLVIDVVEGVTVYFKKLLEQCLKNNKKIVLVINKMDRLVLELKLPPSDGYHKIKHTLDEVNIAV